MAERTQPASSPTDRVGGSMKMPRSLRAALLVGYLLVMTGGVLAVTIYDYQQNKDLVVGLSDDVLKSVEGQVVTELEEFLSSASSMAQFLARLAAEGNKTALDDVPLLDRVASDLLRSYEQLAMFNIADTRGQFLMPKKMPDGAIDTKSIRIVDGRREVTWTRRNTAGEVVQVEPVEGDTYDPRTRPWYRGAARTGGLYWTDVYIFFTDKQPGVTAAAPVYQKDGELAGVLGLDIELASISDFLARLNISDNGRVAVVTREGKVVAHPDASKTMRTVAGQLRSAHVTEIDDPALRRAYDRYRLEGEGRRTLNIAGERFVCLARTLPERFGQAWTVLIVAPERDFVGLAASNTRRTFGLTAAVILVGTVLGLVVLIHGLRSDRRAAEAIERSQRQARRGEALAELACDRQARPPDSPEVLAAAARMVGVSRVSLWQVDPGEQMLTLRAAHDAEALRPTGLQLPLNAVRSFAALAESDHPVPIADALADARTKGLVDPYLRPDDVRSMLVVALDVPGDRRQLLAFEQRGRRRNWSDERSEHAALAGRVVSANAAPMTGPDAGPGATSPRPAAAAAKPTGEPSVAKARSTPDPRRAAVRAAAAEEATGNGHGQNSGELASAAVVCLSLAQVEHDPAEAVRIRRAARRFAEQAARTFECDRMTWQNERFFAVFDAHPDTAETARRAVELAICLAEDFDDCVTGRAAAIKPQLGIDLAAVTVETDGAEADGLALSGSAVQRAGLLARTAPAGEIQISAAVNETLGGAYASARRGRYFTRELGEVEIHSVEHDES